jgi:hypothetical protein
MISQYLPISNYKTGKKKKRKKKSSSLSVSDEELIYGIIRKVEAIHDTITNGGVMLDRRLSL